MCTREMRFVVLRTYYKWNDAGLLAHHDDDLKGIHAVSRYHCYIEREYTHALNSTCFIWLSFIYV